MSQPYFTEDQKLVLMPWPKWTMEQCMEMHDILDEKGYFINCVSRLGCDRKHHDAWSVQRKDIPQLIEELFRQRITVEVQAEGHGKAGIIFVYDYPAKQILDAIKKFRRSSL